MASDTEMFEANDDEQIQRGFSFTRVEREKMAELMKEADEARTLAEALRGKTLEEQGEYWSQQVSRCGRCKDKAYVEYTVAQERVSRGELTVQAVIDNYTMRYQRTVQDEERAECELEKVRTAQIKVQNIRLHVDKLPVEKMSTRYEFLQSMTVLRKAFMELNVPDSHKIVVARSFVTKGGKGVLNATVAADIVIESTLRSADDIIEYYVKKYKEDTVNCFQQEFMQIIIKSTERGVSHLTLVRRLLQLRAHSRAWDANRSVSITDDSFKQALLQVCGGAEELKLRWLNDQRTIDSFSWESLYEICVARAKAMLSGQDKRSQDKPAIPPQTTSTGTGGGKRKDDDKHYGGNKREKGESCSECMKRPYHKHHRANCAEIQNDSEAIEAARNFFAAVAANKNK